MGKKRCESKKGEDVTLVSVRHTEPDVVEDGKAKEGGMQLAALQAEDHGHDSDDDVRSTTSSSSVRSRKASTDLPLPTPARKKQGKAKKKGKSKGRVTKDDPRLPVGTQIDKLPARGDKYNYKGGRSKHSVQKQKDMSSPASKAEVQASEGGEPSEEEAAAAAAALAASARRSELVGRFEERMAALASKAPRGRRGSFSMVSAPARAASPVLCTRRPRSVSCDAIVTTVDSPKDSGAMVKAADVPGVADFAGEGSNEVLVSGEEGREEVSPTSAGEQQEEEDPNSLSIHVADVNLALKLATQDNMGLQSPRACSPTSNLASAEDIVRQASSSGATEQAPSLEAPEGEAVLAQLDEQEGSTEGVDAQGGVQEDELPVSGVEVIEGMSGVDGQQGEQLAGVPEEQPKEHESARRSYKDVAVEVVSRLGDKIRSVCQTVAATAVTAWESFTSSCMSLLDAGYTVCHTAYASIYTWATSA